MNIENGATPAANDTAVDTATSQQPTDTTTVDISDEVDDQLDEGAEPADVEVEYEGQTYKLPTALKDALLRQQDYTRKTQEVAEGRKGLDADREQVKQFAEATRAHIKDYASIVSMDEQLDAYSKVNWTALQAQDPEAAQTAWRDRELLKEKRETAARAWSQREQERNSNEQREYAKRIENMQAELPKLVPGWSSEMDTKLSSYGTAQGLSLKEMGQATLQNPNFMKILHKANLYDESQKKQQKQQTFDAAQGARPVTRVGGSGGGVSRRTTDATGDALSTDEWVKRERERLRKR